MSSVEMRFHGYNLLDYSTLHIRANNRIWKYSSLKRKV